MNEYACAIAICRRASDPLVPGNLVGIACKICGKALQVSPMAHKQIEEVGMIPLCNDCGFAMQKKFTEAGVSQDILLSPNAQSQITKIISKMAAKN
jgi:hypothetical protein